MSVNLLLLTSHFSLPSIGINVCIQFQHFVICSLFRPVNKSLRLKARSRRCQINITGKSRVGKLELGITKTSASAGLGEIRIKSVKITPGLQRTPITRLGCPNLLEHGLRITLRQALKFRRVGQSLDLDHQKDKGRPNN